MITVYGLWTLEKKTPFVYGNNNALMEISSAHNFGACTNVSCSIPGLKRPCELLSKKNPVAHPLT